MRDERDLSYLETHEWADIDGDSAYIGIDDFAQNEMGDIVFVNLPEVGDMVEAGEVFGDVESVKAVSDLFSPVSGKVVEVNENVLESPGLLNEEPYESWLIKVEEITDQADLMDCAAMDKLNGKNGEE